MNKKAATITFGILLFIVLVFTIVVKWTILAVIAVLLGMVLWIILYTIFDVYRFVVGFLGAMK